MSLRAFVFGMICIYYGLYDTKSWVTIFCLENVGLLEIRIPLLERADLRIMIMEFSEGIYPVLGLS